MWLLRKLAPDFRTIAGFRRDNGPAIHAVCHQFTLLCRESGLFDIDLVAIAGSKFSTADSRQRIFTEHELKQMIQRIDEQIDRYLQELDENDEQEPDSDRPTAEALKEKIETLKRRRQEFRALQEQLEGSEQKLEKLL